MNLFFNCKTGSDTVSFNLFRTSDWISFPWMLEETFKSFLCNNGSSGNAYTTLYVKQPYGSCFFDGPLKVEEWNVFEIEDADKYKYYLITCPFYEKMEDISAILLPRHQAALLYFYNNYFKGDLTEEEAREFWEEENGD